MLIDVPQLGKQYSVDVGHNNTYKSARNRTFASESPHQKGAKLVQKKYCSATGNEVQNSEVTNKLLKIGKEYISIPNEQLKEIQDNIAGSETEIKIKSVLKRTELPYYRVEGAKWVKPTVRTRDYVELRELCKDFTLIGEAVFRSNSYEVALATEDNQLIVVLFATESRMSQKPNLDNLQGIEVRQDILDMAKANLESEAVDNHDFSKFEDKRTQQVDELLEKVALGEPLPVVSKATTTVVAEDEDAELERLKAELERKRATAKA